MNSVTLYPLKAVSAACQLSSKAKAAAHLEIGRALIRIFGFPLFRRRLGAAVVPFSVDRVLCKQILKRGCAVTARALELRLPADPKLLAKHPP